MYKQNVLEDELYYYTRRLFKFWNLRLNQAINCLVFDTSYLSESTLFQYSVTLSELINSWIEFSIGGNFVNEGNFVRVSEDNFVPVLFRPRAQILSWRIKSQLNGFGELCATMAVQ